MVTNAHGQEKYGHRQIFDLLNPTFRFHAERVIRKLIGHTAGHPNVIGFQIDNETKHYDNRGNEIQRQFLEYLKEKFETPEKLNQTFCCPTGAIPSTDGKIFRTFPVVLMADWPGSLKNSSGRPLRITWHGRRILSENICVQTSLSPTIWTLNGENSGRISPRMVIPTAYSRISTIMNAAKCLTRLGADIYHPSQDDLTGGGNRLWRRFYPQSEAGKTI